MSPHPGFAVIDLETTGFGGSDRIIEVGVVLLDAQLQQQDTWETLVQPGRDVTNSHVHKLTPAHLKNAPTWEEVAPELARVLAGRIGVAHNVSFEKRFLSKEFRRVGIATNAADAHWVDTKDLVDASPANLQPHAALPDALATAELVRGAKGIAGEPLLFDAIPAPSPVNLVTRNDVDTESDSIEEEQSWNTPNQMLFSDTDLAEDIYADDPLAFADPYSGETSETEQELDILAGWLALTDVTLPHGVRGLAPGVEKRMAGDVLEGLFARCVDELMAACADDTRKMTIVSRRYMGDATLEDLGTLFDVSRERIRQLESQIKRDFDAPSTLSTDVAEALAEKFLPLSKFAEVNAEIPALTRIAEPFAGTYKHYFRMWGLWETDETWIAAPGFAESVDAALATHADSHNVARIADVAADLGADPRLLAEWMAGRSGLLLLPDATHVVLATSHADRAAGVLSLSGEPMTAADIVTATGLDINERSLSNALAADDRIVRVAPTLFALQDWGMEEYSSITDWIAARVAASPTGSVPLTDLLAEAPSIGVSENSVRAYASGAAFLLEDGQVSLPTGQGELIDADPQDYRDLYWHDGAWHMLLTVTHDHLRGSGFAVPRGVAGIYRVPVGGEVAVPSRLGDQFVRVNDLKHSSTSTIRRFLMEAEASEGDRVWLRFAPDGFNLTPAPARRFPVADGADGAAGTAAAPDLPRLLDQMALDPDLASDPKAALTSINEALGLDASAPRRRTVSVFRHRGQDEEADLIRGL